MMSWGGTRCKNEEKKVALTGAARTTNQCRKGYTGKKIYSSAGDRGGHGSAPASHPRELISVADLLALVKIHNPQMPTAMQPLVFPRHIWTTRQTIKYCFGTASRVS